VKKLSFLIVLVIIMVINGCNGDTIINAPPYPPSNPDPYDGEIDVDLNPVLYWECEDPDGDPLSFDIYFGTTPNPPLVEQDYPYMFYEPGILNPSTTYYWKVVARDTNGAVSEGPLWSFTTRSTWNNPPDQPSNPNPSDGETNVSIHPILSWSCSDPDGDPLTYDIYFGTSSDPPLVESNHVGRSYEPGDLEYDTTYYWRIVARDSKGAESIGPVWSFTTVEEISGNLELLGSYDVDTYAPGQIYSPPVLSEGYVHIGGPRGIYRFEGSYVQKITPDSSEVRAGPMVNDGRIYAGNSNGELIYHYHGYTTKNPITSLAFLSSPIFVDGYLYMIDHAGNLFKFDQHGNYISNPFSTDYGNVNSALASQNGVIYIATTGGTVYAFDTTTEVILWNYPTGDNFNGGFAIDSSGNIYIAGNRLWSFTQNGVKRWDYNLGSKSIVNPVIADGKVIVGTEEGNLLCISTSGSLLWNVDLNGPILSSAIIGEGGVVYVVAGTTLYALNMNGGSIIDQLDVGTYVESHPLLHDGKLLFGGNDGKLYVVEVMSDSPNGDWPMFQRDAFRSGVR